MRFVSDRNIELVSTIKNVITVENYCKWYSLYFINENGEVKNLTMYFLKLNKSHSAIMHGNQHQSLNLPIRIIYH